MASRQDAGLCVGQHSDYLGRGRHGSNAFTRRQGFKSSETFLGPEFFTVIKVETNGLSVCETQPFLF